MRNTSTYKIKKMQPLFHMTNDRLETNASTSKPVSTVTGALRLTTKVESLMLIGAHSCKMSTHFWAIIFIPLVKHFPPILC